MAPQNTKLNHLSPLTTNWQNRSMSSISATSDTATFHSAHAHLSNLELRPLSKHTNMPSTHIQRSTTTTTTTTSTPIPLCSPELDAIKMSRQDSGYSETHIQTPTPRSPTTSSRRTSITSGTSSTRPSNPTLRPKRTITTSSHSSRPSTKRNSRSEARIRTSTSSSSRPIISHRHTTAFISPAHPSTPPQQTQQHEYFQFPSLPQSSSPPTSSSSPSAIPPPPPPPTTIHYWTSDQTRRLEYAAIDAASKGLKGFFLKLLPDCVVPNSSKRMGFHCEGEDGASDCGSVRRYRLVLPEEKGDCVGKRAFKEGRRGLLRRWTWGGRREVS